MNTKKNKTKNISYIVEEISDKKKILNILKVFSQELPSLREGKIQINDMAEKFSKNARFIVLKNEEEYIGFSAFYSNDKLMKLGYISMIAVSSPYKGLGYGQIILNDVVSISKECGMEKIDLEVNKNNKNAIKFYKKNGFYLLTLNKESNFIFRKELGRIENEKN